MVDFGQHYEIRVLDGGSFIFVSLRMSSFFWKLNSLRQQEDTRNQKEFDRNIAGEINKEALEVVVTIDSTQNKPPHDLDAIIPTKLTCFVKFSSMFAISDSKRLPEEKATLLINYVLVLTLFADDFRSDPSDIANDLRINVVALRTYYEYLGCKLVREKNVVLATLLDPLVFPSVRRNIRR
uniref:DNA binding protein n=1 Tax=Solanum tuberosum TaxID=4113 RepID=M0ZR13_SOLTU